MSATPAAGARAAPDPALPALEETVCGKYRIERVLGQGGMGVVFAASHLRLEQQVALKVLRPELRDDADCVARFEREARAAAKLKSPHAARIFDVDTTERGLPFFVMELLEGQDLASYLRARGRLPYGHAVDLVLQAASAVAEAHDLGIIHRDLKPGNLFLAGAARTVKVVDFGISKVLGEATQNTVTAIAIGTPHYMSPEQMLASKTINGQADVWSLGVILYRLLSGRFPFDGENPAAIAVAVATSPPAPFAEADQVPEALAAVVRRALERDRASRWPDVEAFSAALAPFREARGPITPRESTQKLIAEGPPSFRIGDGPPSGRIAEGPPSGRTPPSMPSMPSMLLNGGEPASGARPLTALMSVPGAEPASGAHALTAPMPVERRTRALPAAIGALSTLLLVGIVLTVISATKRMAPTPSALSSSAQSSVQPEPSPVLAQPTATVAEPPLTDTGTTGAPATAADAGASPKGSAPTATTPAPRPRAPSPVVRPPPPASASAPVVDPRRL